MYWQSYYRTLIFIIQENLFCTTIYNRCGEKLIARNHKRKLFVKKAVKTAGKREHSLCRHARILRITLLFLTLSFTSLGLQNSQLQELECQPSLNWINIKTERKLILYLLYSTYLLSSVLSFLQLLPWFLYLLIQSILHKLSKLEKEFTCTSVCTMPNNPMQITTFYVALSFDPYWQSTNPQIHFVKSLVSKPVKHYNLWKMRNNSPSLETLSLWE